MPNPNQPKPDPSKMTHHQILQYLVVNVGISNEAIKRNQDDPVVQEMLERNRTPNRWFQPFKHLQGA